MNNELVCYCIQDSLKQRTYIGATKNFSRRLRQHNGEIKGGAKATKDRNWEPIIHIKGFNNWIETLQFEWHWKHCIRRPKYRGIFHRIDSLEKILSLDKWSHLHIETKEEIACYISVENEMHELIF